MSTTKEKIKSITIQPASPKEDPFKMPYPYHITRTGLVGRQDFWHGSPYRLIGFSKKPKAGEVELMLAEFWEEPQQAVGMYPVFADQENNWSTYTTKTVSVHQNKAD